MLILKKMRISCVFFFHFPSIENDCPRIYYYSKRLIRPRLFSRALPSATQQNGGRVNVNSVDLNSTIHGSQLERFLRKRGDGFDLISSREEGEGENESLRRYIIE